MFAMWRQEEKKSYAERIKNPAPHEIKVNMWEQKEVHLGPQEEQKKLFTYGLGGCTAVALVCKCKNGHWYAAMNHYPPINNHAKVIHRFDQ